MEIALSGLNPQFDTSASVESARQRQQEQQAAQQQSAAARGAGARSSDDRQSQSRTAPAQGAAENIRVINGEVLSSETTRVSPRESSASFLAGASGRSSSNQQPSSEPDSRRVSVERALQNFQENQALVADEASPRQVSGIIDEFV